MGAFVIIVVIVLSLWSITTTIEKQTEKLLKVQNDQLELLNKIHRGIVDVHREDREDEA